MGYLDQTVKWWHWTDRKLIPPFSGVWRQYAHCEAEFYQLIGVKVPVLLIFKQGTTHYYFSKPALLTFNKNFLSKILDNSGFVQQIKKEHYLRINKLRKSSEKILALDYSKLTNLQLYNQLLTHFQNYSKLVVYTCFSHFGTYTLEDDLARLIRQNHPAKTVADLGKYLPILTSSSAASWDTKDKIALYQLYLKIKNLKTREKLKQEMISRSLDQHIKKFGLIGYNFIGPMRPRRYYLEQLKLIENNPQVYQKLLIRPSTKVLKQTKDKIIRRLNLIPAEVKIINALKILIDLKEYRRMYYTQAQYALLPFSKEITKRFGLTARQVNHLFFSDFKRMLVNGKKTDKKVLDERYKLSVWYYDGHKEKVLSGQPAKKFIKQEMTNRSKIPVTVSLSGQVACSGKARGICKVVTSESKINKVKEGDILVSVFTNPHYVPAMKRSAAVVTNEGGLTSHASIIARELKKPCIIGTKIATKVLKDGDMVEVDAEKGVVRKIS